MTIKTTTTELQRAIYRSASRGELVTAPVESIDAAISALRAAWAGDIDYVETAEYTDVWGWADETPENEHEWRLYLVEARKISPMSVFELDEHGEATGIVHSYCGLRCVPTSEQGMATPSKECCSGSQCETCAATLDCTEDN